VIPSFRSPERRIYARVQFLEIANLWIRIQSSRIAKAL